MKCHIMVTRNISPTLKLLILDNLWKALCLYKRICLSDLPEQTCQFSQPDGSAFIIFSTRCSLWDRTVFGPKRKTWKGAETSPEREDCSLNRNHFSYESRGEFRADESNEKFYTAQFAEKSNRMDLRNNELPIFARVSIHLWFYRFL